MVDKYIIFQEYYVGNGCFVDKGGRFQFDYVVDVMVGKLYVFLVQFDMVNIYVMGKMEEINECY